jgi:hypothetical protein
MRLAAKAWRLRQAAREALAAAHFDRALALATEAQQTQATASGKSLRALAAWLSQNGIC